MTPDYRKYYDLERYLFTEVNQHFAEEGNIKPADLYMIFIWKANRAKNRHRDRLAKKAGTFAAAVREISASLVASSSAKNKLQVLMNEWGFRLPTATSVLTVLYP